MAIYIKLYGGKAVKKVIEREFVKTSDAVEYLEEWGVPPKQKGSTFKVGEYDFTLSHSVEEIRKGKDLPNNPSYSVSKSSIPIMPNKGSKAEAIARTREEGSAPNKIGALPKPINGKVVVLKEICRQINMEPRIARQKLRKLFKGNGNQRWEWSPEEAAKVKEALLGK